MCPINLKEHLREREGERGREGILWLILPVFLHCESQCAEQRLDHRAEAVARLRLGHGWGMHTRTLERASEHELCVQQRAEAEREAEQQPLDGVVAWVIWTQTIMEEVAQ